MCRIYISDYSKSISAAGIVDIAGWEANYSNYKFPVMWKSTFYV